jgi:S1-C subfamily serine protease
LRKIAIPVLVALAVACLAAAGWMASKSRSTEPASYAAPVTAGSPSQSSPIAGGDAAQPGAQAGTEMETASRLLARLGVTGEPSRTEPKGLRITGFVSGPSPSPLKTIGVRKGDIIVSCNKATGQTGMRCVAAIEGLQNRGEPLTLVVARDGKQITLTRSEKLPAGGAAKAPR